MKQIILGVFTGIAIFVAALALYFVFTAAREVFFPQVSDTCGYDMENSRPITCGEAWVKRHQRKIKVEQNNFATPDAPKQVISIYHSTDYIRA